MEVYKKQELLVSICSITYNHAPYIRQCLDGFLMQKTNFPVEVIINDDCSTDGTTEIIREYAEKYPDIIKPIFHEENQYQKGVRGMFQRFVFPKARGKYIALCEGDDYWTDPLKLQKQVDFLEANPEYGLVYTDYNRKYEATNKIEQACIRAGKTRKINSFEDMLIYGGYIVPCSWLVRKNLLIQERKSCVDGSFAIALDIFAVSKIKILDEVTCVYRVLPESACHTRSLAKSYNYAKGVVQIKKDYIKKYNVSESVSDEALLYNYVKILPKALAMKDFLMVSEIRELIRKHLTIGNLMILCFSSMPFADRIARLYYKKKGWLV